jgi:thymidine phosphorylase
MRPGILFLIVGASGVGKDTLIAAAMATLRPTGRYVTVRRAITRQTAIGEDHEPMSLDAFQAREASGGFLHSWEAHGLHYGLPVSILADLSAGRNVIANGSRAAISGLVGKVEQLAVVEIKAPERVLRSRIAGRGRETEGEINERLSREVGTFPAGIDAFVVMNDSTVEEGAERLVSTLETAAARMVLRRMPLHAGRINVAYLPTNSQVVAGETYLDAGRIDLAGSGRSIRAIVNLVDPGGQLQQDEIGLSCEAFDRLGLSEGTLVSICRTPTPASRLLLQRKIEGQPLNAEEYETLFRDVAEGRYPESEVAAFLLKVIQTVDDSEVIAVAKARSRLMPRIDWNVPIVVDKHSLGGIPGSRITLIVVPIVAAHGLLMPKTSSRAITSASGTADVMEAICHVDLDAAGVRRVVQTAGGCIAWNGRLNHSALDDIVNAITRPLGLDSNRWSVASILSKKWSAGSTHIVVDMPCGPRAKLKSLDEAKELGRLFEIVGEGLGLTVRAFATDGRAAIGRGIGPALELRDDLLVLKNAAEAPQDLREKALMFAGEILAFDPAVGTPADGRRLAEDILRSGAALQSFDRIVSAQGAVDQVLPGRLTHVVRAKAQGVIDDVDGWHLAGIARRAGAPMDKSAGIYLAAEKGDVVQVGTPLFTIHTSSAAELEAAALLAAENTGFTLAETRRSA